MPMRRIQGQTLDELQQGVEKLEAAGEIVIQVTPYAGEWVVVTEPAKPNPAAKKTITR